MQHTKKKAKSQLTKKRVASINPREYTLMGASPQFVHFNPSGETYMTHPISHRLEKWILIILLAFAMAAFMGFKFFENSEMSFSMNTPSGSSESLNGASHSISSDAEFKEEFTRNRKEARSLMEEHNIGSKKYKPKFGKTAGRYYAKKTSSVKKVAKKSAKKKITSKVSRKKTVARR